MWKTAVLGLVALTLQPAACPAADDKTEARIGKLIQAMADADKRTVLSAIQKLGDCGSGAKIAVPALTERLRDRDREVANQAGRALAQIGAAAVPKVIAVLADSSPAARIRALLTLGTMGREAGAAAAPVSELLKDKEARTRLVAALVLGAMHEEAQPAAPALARALRDPEPQVQLVAADALYQIGAETIGPIARAAADRDLTVRLNAVRTLGRFLESDEAVTALAGALLDPSAQVRAAASAALVRLGRRAEAAVPRLLDLLGEHDLEVQVQAFTALAAIALRHDGSFGRKISRLNDARRWADSMLPGAAAGDLPKKVRQLAGLLTDSKATLRLTAALALADIGKQATAARLALSKLGSDRDRAVRAAATLALAALDDRHLRDVERLDVLLKEAIESYRGDPEPAALIRLHILSAAGEQIARRGAAWKAMPRVLEASIQRSRDWVREKIARARFTPDDLPALLEGINLPARFNLGFTEPFTTLALQVQRIVHQSKTPLPALAVFNGLGKDVPPDSLYWPAIQQQWRQGLARVPVDYLILEKQQSIVQQTAVLHAIEAQAAIRQRTDSLMLQREWHRRVVTFTMSGSY